MKTTLIVLALLAASPAWADDCAKYANDLAYNACLAAHGPRARMVHVGAAPAARGPAGRRRASAERPHGRSSHGRSSMVFSVAK